jgi:hypothetical protein
MCNHCINQDVFTYQASVIQKSIEEDKWYLSERAGHDVGWDVAKDHFFNTYSMGFAAGFRSSFCGLVCPKRFHCSIAAKYLIHSTMTQSGC